MVELFIENWFALISTLWAVFSFIRWMYQFYSSKKQEVKIERMKQQLEFSKQQGTLNDEKFRNAYQWFVSLMFDTIWKIKDKKEQGKKEVEKWMLAFMKSATLFAWPKTLKSFWQYRKESWKENSKNILLYVWNLMLKMREDLWVDNSDIDEYDILQIFIIWNAKEGIEKLN